MYASIIIEFGMECGNKLFALLCGNNMSVNSSKHLSIARYTLDKWGTDKCHWHIIANTFYLALHIEASKLSTIGVAAHIYIHCGYTTELLTFNSLSKKYKSGTCTKYWQTVLYVRYDRLKQAKILKELKLNCTLATWNNKTILRLLPIRQLAYLKGFDTETLEHTLVLYEGTLKCQYSNSHYTVSFKNYLPRSAMSTSISCSLIPTIASPRSSDNSASFFGSLKLVTA